MTMGKESTATAEIALPEDDGSIERAFGEADARLSAWLAAMREAEPQLSALAHSPEVPSVELSEPSSDPIESPESDQDFAVACEPTEPEADAPAEVAEPAEAASEFEDVESIETPESSAMVLEPRVKTAEQEPESQHEESLDSSFEDRHREDEELLASLDEETARAIHVMRRVSLDNKSVRELLEQYEQEKRDGSGKPAPAKKRSWFSRGN